MRAIFARSRPNYTIDNYSVTDPVTLATTIARLQRYRNFILADLAADPRWRAGSKGAGAAAGVAGLANHEPAGAGGGDGYQGAPHHPQRLRTVAGPV